MVSIKSIYEVAAFYKCDYKRQADLIMKKLWVVFGAILKGILSRKSIFLYVKGCVLLSSETYFLSASGMINPLIFIILFKILVIVVGEKCLPGPKLDCEIWVPVHN